MAKTRIDLAQLERQGRSALARLPWWDPDLPASLRRPQTQAMLLRQIGAELPAREAPSPDFIAARSALDRYAAATDLAERCHQRLLNALSPAR
jgi:hypothetical protein